MPVSLRLRFVPGRYAVAKLPAVAAIPEWASGPGFLAIIRADDELTIVCNEGRVPKSVEAAAGWICIRTIGPFDFQATGIVHSLIAPLSSNDIGVFVVCTFDGEHLLISERDCEKACDLLVKAGHELQNEAGLRT